MASIVQKFDLTMQDPSYLLALRQTVTIKPKGFFIHASLRKGRKITDSLPPSIEESGSIPPSTHVERSTAAKGQRIHIFYGSNAGSSEAFAQKIVSAAPAHGTLRTIGPMVIIQLYLKDSTHQWHQWIRRQRTCRPMDR
jgi:cytochrome P450 / NADPH-cytochrome P450 reductase